MGEGDGKGEGRSVGEWEVELTDLYKKMDTSSVLHEALTAT